MLDTASHLLEVLANAVNNGPQQSSGISEVIEQFSKFQPLLFQGSSNPLVVEDWNKKLEKTFTFIVYTEAQKVFCASFMLKKVVSYWWDMVKRPYHTDENPLV